MSNTIREYGILDTPAETSFDELARVAAQIFGAPLSLITLADDDRLWFKARVGVESTETLRADSLCGCAIDTQELFVVSDALADERFASHPFVSGPPFVRFYAGVPLL